MWKYDLKYDERKYAFEYELQALKKLGINESMLFGMGHLFGCF